MLAARNGHDRILDLYLNAGADLNTQNYNGVTALMLAAQNGHNRCMDRLIQAGAYVNVYDN